MLKNLFVRTLALAIMYNGWPYSLIPLMAAEKKEPRQIETGCTAIGKSIMSDINKSFAELTTYEALPVGSYDCSEAVVYPIAEYSHYSIVQLSNSKYCDDVYCQTFIYDGVRGKILLAVKSKMRPLVYESPAALEIFNLKYRSLLNTIVFETINGSISVQVGYGMPVILTEK